MHDVGKIRENYKMLNIWYKTGNNNYYKNRTYSNIDILLEKKLKFVYDSFLNSVWIFSSYIFCISLTNIVHLGFNLYT